MTTKSTCSRDGVVAVVVSLPRTGTHFLIDFLRKNFAELNARVPLWKSAESLYINLDNLLHDRAWALDSAGRPSFIVKTHELPFSPSAEQILVDLAMGRKIVYFTPVRAERSFLASYARYIERSHGVTVGIDKADPYYGDGRSTGEVFETFFEWGLSHSTFIDVEKAIGCPQCLALDCGKLLGLQPKPLANRLPRRRKSSGPLGEVVTRLSGREASDVVIPKAPLASHLPDPGPFGDLIAAARERAIPRSPLA